MKSSRTRNAEKDTIQTEDSGVWQIFLASLRTYPINFKTAVPAWTYGKVSG